MYPRILKKTVEQRLWKGKVIVIYGARQVGKTTLVKEIINSNKNISLYLNCDEPDIREALTNKSSTELIRFLGEEKKLVVIDEAQRVKNIGLTLKLLIDNYPKIQIIATGSSSFELSNMVIEPLTGRKYEYYLFPLSVSELKIKHSDMELNRLLEKMMISGMYPEVFNSNKKEAQTILKTLASSTLFKDVLQFQDIRNSDILEKLLQALALQIGNEVSYTELASLLGINKITVANYIRILEQAFIIFTVSPFSRNLRNELKKMRKIYFYDLGLRNALINNFNPLNLRNDVGALWENFLISERKKRNSYNDSNVNSYFWRTHQQQEIDYIEEGNGKISAFEFKLGKGKGSEPKIFTDAYKNASYTVVNKNNWLEFVK